MSKFGVMVGIKNQILVGSLNKKGNMFLSKEDMTVECLVAVAEHVENFGEDVIISKADGTPEYKIIVEKL